MQLPTNIASLVLLGEGDTLANAICRELFQSVSLRKSMHSNGARQELVRRVTKHLQVLAACIEYSSPRLLVDYVNWSRRLDSTLPQIPEEIDLVFAKLNLICAKNVPKKVGRIISIFIEAACEESTESGSASTEFTINPLILELQERYLASILNMDRNQALQIVMEAMEAGVGIESIYLEMLQTSLREIGSLWQAGKITVALEHYCTAATQFVMAQLQPYFITAKPVNKVLIACCVGDESHEIGLRIVTDLFEVNGWDTVYIGANVPPKSVVSSIRASQGDVLAVSTTMTNHLFDVAATIAAVRESADLGDAKILVGGYPFNVDPFLWRRMRADAWANDGREALRVANQFVIASDRDRPKHSSTTDVNLETLDQPTSAFRSENIMDNLTQLNNELVTAQRKLTKANVELRSLNEANSKKASELEEADRRKDQFLAMLAHELRGPLAPMSHAVEILKLKGDDQTTVKEVYDVLQRQIQYMARLISDLLDASRIAHGKIKLDREILQLGDIVKRAVEIASPLMEERRHRLDCELWPSPIVIEGDAIRLTQVLANLLTNAAKYTDPGGLVSISTELRADRAVIVVLDNGIGITPEVLPSMFSTFSQEERARDYSQGGLGLGLSLVKQLVEMHGGSVGAHSQGIGKGSAFTVSIPALEETLIDGEKKEAESLDGENVSPRRILIADDVASLASITGRLFEILGHEALVVLDGQSVLDEYHKFKPHIVVLDLHLSDMTGFEVAQQIRRIASCDQPVIVALTGSSDLHEKATEAGFDEYLVKPVDIHVLQRLTHHPKIVDQPN